MHGRLILLAASLVVPLLAAPLPDHKVVSRDNTIELRHDLSVDDAIRDIVKRGPVVEALPIESRSDTTVESKREDPLAEDEDEDEDSEYVDDVDISDDLAEKRGLNKTPGGGSGKRGLNKTPGGGSGKRGLNKTPGGGSGKRGLNKTPGGGSGKRGLNKTPGGGSGKRGLNKTPGGGSGRRGLNKTPGGGSGKRDLVERAMRFLFG
ncbi:hypothetical protein N0V83_004596 [Neocucurbitaria cava]|uniref:Uncharacterized protein n=1 Tax=Neocucurbitaria cava TaxID=798079 RepID=A0A9W8Y9F4_9PLEO|nr:hypothetical protein N0V83_004596 [Neocucurbitaria cava]